jgi:hypothetical protein
LLKISAFHVLLSDQHRRGKERAGIMKRKSTTQKGVWAVEFALGLPILTLITSIIEFKEVFTRPVTAGHVPHLRPDPCFPLTVAVSVLMIE